MKWQLCSNNVSLEDGSSEDVFPGRWWLYGMCTSQLTLPRVIFFFFLNNRGFVYLCPRYVGEWISSVALKFLKFSHSWCCMSFVITPLGCVSEILRTYY